MQPYQAAGEETSRQREAPGNTLKSGARTAAALIGGGAAARGGSALIGRIMPFLNDYVPDSLAKKGLEKIDPRLGKFIDLAMDSGKNFGEVKDFLKLKAEGSLGVSEQKKAKENRNIIEQYSPELHGFIKQALGRGVTPTQIAAITAVNNPKFGNEKFKNIIKKIEKDHKTDWASIVESIYGGAQQGQPKQPEQQPEQQQPQGQSQQPQQGQPNDFRQMAAAGLQKILSL